jgi:hypothetical protein
MRKIIKNSIPLRFDMGTQKVWSRFFLILKKILAICLLLTSSIIIPNDCDQVSSLFPAFSST